MWKSRKALLLAAFGAADTVASTSWLRQATKRLFGRSASDIALADRRDEDEFHARSDTFRAELKQENSENDATNKEVVFGAAVTSMCDFLMARADVNNGKGAAPAMDVSLLDDAVFQFAFVSPGMLGLSVLEDARDAEASPLHRAINNQLFVLKKMAEVLRTLAAKTPKQTIHHGRGSAFVELLQKQRDRVEKEFGGRKGVLKPESEMGREFQDLCIEMATLVNSRRGKPVHTDSTNL